MMAALSVLVVLSLLPVLFLLFSSLAGGEAGEEPDVRLAFLASAVLWGVLLTLITNGLSLVTALNRTGLSLCWGFVLAGLVLYGWRSGRLKRGWARLQAQTRRLEVSPFERVVLVIGLVYIALLFIIAWVAPPNTNDSLRYHMGRVMHWQQDQTVAHYNTPIAAQLWMPPWSEMAIANLVVLTGSDRLANMVQAFAMLGALAGLSWIAGRLGSKTSGQVFTLVFAFSLPMGILQSTSTQNDYTNAFWVVCLAAFVLQGLRDPSGWLSIWMVGLSTGLGILTKGTFYAFAAPFLLVWVAALGLQRAWKRLAVAMGILLAAVLLLNGFFWWQNSQVFRFPLGPLETVRDHANQSYTLKAALSNALRNLTIHLGTPYGIINGNLQKGIVQVHAWIGQEINDPATTLDEYRVKRYLTEDRAGNPWHLLAVPTLLAFAWLSRKPPGTITSQEQQDRLGVRSTAFLYAILLLMQFFLFSILYKWQSTGSRLQLPWFVLLAPLAGFLWQQVNPAGLRKAVAVFFLVVALPFVVNNPSRPFLPFRGDPVTIWNTPRQELFFRNTPEVMPGTVSITEALTLTGCTQVGLRIDSSDPEYLFWALLENPGRTVRLEHLFPEPPIAPSHLEGFAPCAVICTFCNTGTLYGLTLDSVHYGGYSLYLAGP